MTAKTPIYDQHAQAGAKLVEFAGWQLPMTYPDGLIAEHLACRKHGAIFDICHMGRFMVGRAQAETFLDHQLTNRASKLEPGQAQYTIISDEHGLPVDDAYLYHLEPDRYLLVVNAANKQAAWDRLHQHNGLGAEVSDISNQMAMLAVQGPQSERLLAEVLEGDLPQAGRNQADWMHFKGNSLFVARTGYTGEPVGFELFPAWQEAPALWQALVEAGASVGVVPAGLGARDTLRLEAGLPLYGREYARDRAILAVPTARFGVDLGPERGDFVGKAALVRQAMALANGDVELLPQRIYALAGPLKGMMREGSKVRGESGELGELTSATAIPAWRFEGDRPGEEHYTRLLGLALLDSTVQVGQELEVLYRKRELPAKVVGAFTKPMNGYLKPIEF